MPSVYAIVDGGGPLRATKFVQLLVSTTVIGFDLAPGTTARRVFVSVHTNAIRVRFDGGTPTPTEGHQITAGSGAPGDVSRGIELVGSDSIAKFRMCRNGSTDSEVAYTSEV
jgi:hypothetical protein